MAQFGSPYVHKVKITVEWASGLDSGTRELAMDNDSHHHATRMHVLEGVIAMLGLAAQQQKEPGLPQSQGGKP